MTEVVIAFPEPGKQMNMNDRLGWRAKARLTKAWRHAAFYAATSALNQHRVERGMPLSFVRLGLPVSRAGGRRDPSNWAPTTKAVVDGIVEAGVFVDDDSTHLITLEPTFHVARNDRGARIVHVRIRPATEPWSPV